MTKLIGYARISNKAQDTDRQIQDLLAAGSPTTSALEISDSECSTSAAETSTLKLPWGAIVFTVMATLAQMELEIKRERINDSVTKRRATGGDLGGRRPTFTDSQIRTAEKMIQAGEPATQVDKNLGMSRATLYRRIKELDL